jgi:hypothetical protein
MKTQYIFQSSDLASLSKIKKAFETLYGKSETSIKGAFLTTSISGVAFINDKFYPVLRVVNYKAKIEILGEVYTIDISSDDDNGQICLTAISEQKN